MEIILEDDGARAQAKREQILEGAKRVFLREGFAATSTDALAREAGISKRTLYSYYPSKEELFIHVVRRLTVENPQTQVINFVRGLKPHNQEELHAALLTLAQKIITTMMQPEDLALMRAIIADSHRFPQLTETLRSTIPERAATEVSFMLERARTNGVAIQPGNTEIMTRLFIGPLLSYALLDGLLRPQSQPQPPAIEKIEEIIHLFMKAILVKHQSERNPA
ncbi:TetR family transcriptional regulator [Dictyobacter vulcani]|uniref:TetR family transcriptional regulator n=1 Tax=Dictyobacter vulcani TaxID=2607529 RepID=A0A5J4KYU9_9CHLR|nr:TetR/AcrR family transcriptional regulator [Dictyobacter vulcani]GER90336.1 TetR family transcriptional regulator [Dictyobacter vulcani]